MNSLNRDGEKKIRIKKLTLESVMDSVLLIGFLLLGYWSLKMLDIICKK